MRTTRLLANSSRWTPKRGASSRVHRRPAIGRPAAARALSDGGRWRGPGPTLGAVRGSAVGSGSAPPPPQAAIATAAIGSAATARDRARFEHQARNTVDIVTHDDDRTPLLTPGRALAGIGIGHGIWGSIAYRDELREIARAGVFDSVGDGIFQRAHARGPRAAAFWFMFITPLLGAGGYLVDRADRAGDGRALQVSGRAFGAVGLLGFAVMPRSGFPLSVPLAVWYELRGRALRRG
jgi:hypothetical protein